MSIFKRDIKKDVWQWGLLGGLGEGIYILLITSFLMTMEKSFPFALRPFWGFLFFLTLFVFSVAISGLLVLGRPLLLIFNKEYKEAILTLGVSLGILFVMLVVVILLALV